MPIDINYYLKVRPTTEESKGKHFFQINQDKKTIDIEDPFESSKKSSHFNFTFDNIFYKKTPDEIHNETFKNMAASMYKGKEHAIICYGQTGSGKTYSLFGERKKYLQKSADRKGISHIIIEDIFQNPEMANAEVTIAILQITGDKIYDLGKAFATSKARMEKPFSPTSNKAADSFTPEIKKFKDDGAPTPSESKLELAIDSIKATSISSVTQIKIQSIKDYYDSIFYLFETKKGAKQTINDIFSHVIMVITLNYSPPSTLSSQPTPKKGVLYLVDLAGSEKLAKENENFSLSSGVAFDLKNIQKILISISQVEESITYVPYKESKLSQCLKSVLRAGKQIHIIAHIIPVEAAYEDTLSALQYIERCNGQSIKETKTTIDTASKPEHERIIKKIEEENNDLRSQLDNEQNIFKTKLKNIQLSLGINTDLDKMFASPNVSLSNEMEVLRKHKRNCERIQSMEQLKIEIGKKLVKINNKIDDAKLKESKLKTNYESKTKDMTKQQTDLLQENESLKVELSQLKEKLEQEYRNK